MRRKTKLNKPSAWRKRGGRMVRDTRDSSTLLEEAVMRCHVALQALSVNWLRVLGTTERSQIADSIGFSGKTLRFSHYS